MSFTKKDESIFKVIKRMIGRKWVYWTQSKNVSGHFKIGIGIRLVERN